MPGPDPLPTKKPAAKKPVAKKKVVSRAQPSQNAVPGYQFTTNAEQMLRNIPYGSELLWRGKNAPNKNFSPAGYSSLTPVRVGNQWQLFGVADDPLKKYTDPVLAQMRAEQDRSQNWATNTVMPFATQALGGLQNANNATQAAFTNAMGGVAGNISDLAQAAGPQTAGLGGSGGLEAAQAAGLTQAQAQALTDEAAMSGAAGALGFGAAAQDQLAGLNAQVLAMPSQFEQQRNDFLQSLVPLRSQLDQARMQGEQDRQWNLVNLAENRRIANQQAAVEAKIAGINAQVDMAKLDAANAQDARDFAYQAQQDAIQNDQAQQRINASGNSAAAKSRAAYNKIKTKWADGANEWLHGKPVKSSETTADGKKRVTTSYSDPRFSQPAEFLYAATAAGLGVKDAYDIAVANDAKPSRKAVVTALRRRFRGKSSKWINDRATQITGERALTAEERAAAKRVVKPAL